MRADVFYKIDRPVASCFATCLPADHAFAAAFKKGEQVKACSGIDPRSVCLFIRRFPNISNEAHPYQVASN